MNKLFSDEEFWADYRAIEAKIAATQAEIQKAHEEILMDEGEQSQQVIHINHHQEAFRAAEEARRAAEHHQFITQQMNQLHQF